MFEFLKRAKIVKTAEEKRAEALPRTKKVQFEYMDIPQAQSALEADLRAVLSWQPSNYYQTKDRFLQCIFYYKEDYSEIYMRFESRINDLPHGKTGLFQIDKILMRDILRKFGVNINV